MRTFKKGENIWQSNDEITIKALLNSGYEEVKKSVVREEIEPEVVKPKKRSKIED
jgi:hypothetical protein